MRFRLLFLMLTAVLSVSLPAFAQEVRLVYFYPSDRDPGSGSYPNEATIKDELYTLTKNVRNRFAIEMAKHGFPEKIFNFEQRDPHGNPDVRNLRFLKGKYPNNYYRDRSSGEAIKTDKVLNEIEMAYGDMSEYIYLIFANIGREPSQITTGGGVDGTICGVGLPFSNEHWSKGIRQIVFGQEVRSWAIVRYTEDCDPNWLEWVTAHELGHAFGLQHDFRSINYIMSYNHSANELSECAAKWLDVCRPFNDYGLLQFFSGLPASIEIRSPLAYSPSATEHRFQFKVRNIIGGIHAAQLLVVEAETPPGYWPANSNRENAWSNNLGSDNILAVSDCRLSNHLLDRFGETIEFVYSDLQQKPLINKIRFRVMDNQGNVASKTFPLNRLPEPLGAIDVQSLQVRTFSPPLDVSEYFRDPGDTLTYTAQSDALNIATPRIISSQLRIFAGSNIGTATITVTATDSYNSQATQRFTVTVDPSTPNRAPVAVGTIPSEVLTVSESSIPLNLSNYFSDPDGKTLTYTVELSHPETALPQVIGSQLTFWAWNIGSTTVTVTATNSDGLFTIQTFDVTVTAEETEDPSPQPPIPEGLNSGVSIIVENTGSVGLNIRNDPEVRNQNPDNRIGIAYDGATGTITAGPQIDTEGRTWWEVKWDVSNKVQWQHQPANHRGWSVEAIGETGLLARHSPEPVTQSFDLAIESFTISKETLAPNESFTLSVRIHNKGPGDSPGPALSYYHSSIRGLTIEDHPQLQGTVLLGPLKAGEHITKLIPLEAPSTPRTYYYGAWLAANYGDTDIHNDVATEVAVIVSDTMDARVQFIYWTEDNKIYQSLSDGTARKVVLIRAGKRLGRLALDVSGRKIYWTEFPVSGGTTTLKRANLDGSGIENVVVNIGALTDLLLDTSNSKVYWAAIVGRFEGNKIRRSNLNGSQIQDLVTDLNPADFARFELVEGLALDASGGKMYWTETVYERQADNTLQITKKGKIQRSNLNGSRIEDLVTGLSSRAIALDVFDGKLYWINNYASEIQRANLDGSQVEDLVSAPNMETHFFLSLDVSSGKMYWGSSHIILRANLDGTEAEILYQVANPFNNIIGDIVFAILPEDAVHAAPLTTSTMLATTAPTKTSILPNYPNPFNPETWIPYQLAKPADVSVSIYSVDGKLVRTLTLGHQAAGIYQSKSRAAHWDGHNELGERVASGLYFYTFTAGDFTATRKMLIRK